VTTIALWLEYDGTGYAGWQRQRDGRTIQGEIERAIAAVSGRAAAVIGAGRTDAGVHALAHPAHFKTSATLAPAAWLRALNRHLPRDIAVVRAARTADRFHARYAAIGKTYRYAIINRRTRAPLRERHAWTVYPPLAFAPMRRAAAAFVGRHDFGRFRASDPRGKNTRAAVCTIERVTLRRNGDELTITVTADRFLHHMVRRIVGLLV
jgi:tRNA pseudouridine38-40 synthase